MHRMRNSIVKRVFDKYQEEEPLSPERQADEERSDTSVDLSEESRKKRIARGEPASPPRRTGTVKRLDTIKESHESGSQKQS